MDDDRREGVFVPVSYEIVDMGYRVERKYDEDGVGFF